MPFGLMVDFHISGDKLYTHPLKKLLSQNLSFVKASPYHLKINLNQGIAEITLEKDTQELIQKRIEYTASAKGLADLANRILFYLYFPAE